MKRVLAIGSLLLALTGCGTVANFSRESRALPTPYGGVEIAVEEFKKAPRIPNTLLFSDYAYAPNVVFSAIGDTLTLPITVACITWRFCDLALHYDNTPPPSSYSQSAAEGTTNSAEQPAGRGP